MSHLPNKKAIEDHQRNTNIHMLKRKYGQTVSPRESRPPREEYPNDSHYRKTKRFKESDDYDRPSYDQRDSRDYLPQKRSPDRYERDRRGSSKERDRRRQSRSHSKSRRKSHYSRRRHSSSSYSSSSYDKRRKRSSSRRRYEDRRNSRDRSAHKQSLISAQYDQGYNKYKSYVKQERSPSPQKPQFQSTSNNYAQPVQQNQGVISQRQQPKPLESLDLSAPLYPPYEAQNYYQPPLPQQHFQQQPPYLQQPVQQQQQYQFQQSAPMIQPIQSYTQNKFVPQQQYPPYYPQQQQQPPIIPPQQFYQTPQYQQQYNQSGIIPQKEPVFPSYGQQQEVVMQQSEQVQQIQTEQVRKPIDPRDVGVLYCTLAGGNYDKWKELLYKIFGNHPQINLQVFNQVKEEYKKTISKDSQAYKERVTKYLDKNDIQSKVSKQLQYEHQEMKDEEASTQEDLEPQYLQPTEITPISSKRQQEVHKKLDYSEKNYSQLKNQLIETQNKREALLRNIQIKNIRLGCY